MLKRRQIPDIFLGAMLAVAIVAIGFVLGSLPHSGNSTEPESANKADDGTTKHPEQKNWWNDPVADFTLGLVLVGMFQVGLFYVQLKLIGKSLVDAKTAALAAKEAADAAKVSADHIPRVERAYLFLDLTIEYKLLEFNGANDTRSTITFKFRNHGRTPAAIKELHGMAKYWPRGSFPTMADAGRQSVQVGVVLSGGDTIQEGYGIRFPLTKEHRRLAAKSDGRILFWGKIIYANVFGQSCETGWCREFYEGGDGQDEGFYFSGDESLNYYT